MALALSFGNSPQAGETLMCLWGSPCHIEEKDGEDLEAKLGQALLLQLSNRI